MFLSPSVQAHFDGNVSTIEYWAEIKDILIMYCLQSTSIQDSISFMYDSTSSTRISGGDSSYSVYSRGGGSNGTAYKIDRMKLLTQLQVPAFKCRLPLDNLLASFFY